ncbi:unnamed protein product [Spirodela intermedia]|uniref:sterol 22-desaturase n=1 Tax=Spirodela intermedia TaxID=51605 RepID=A0A7I8LEB3_SPIIN|nr:unnamed protein product [Spirodela intermedia]
MASAVAENATLSFTEGSGGGGSFLGPAVLPWAVALAALLLFFEQLSYLRKKGPLPGSTLVVPLLGSAVPMILNPTGYWRRLGEAAATRGLCADYLMGRFIVFLRSADLSHSVFSNVRPDAFQVIGHPFGRKLFGDHNLIYMFGQEHKDLRRRIAPNFTPKALATYLDLQQTIILSHIRKWIEMCESSPSPSSMPLRLLCRDMNLETSQTVFAGTYLSPEARRAFNVDYNLFNVGLMAVPFDLPGFAFRRARLAVHRLVSTLAGCVAESKRRMRSPATEPSCLVDFWMQETVREIAEAEQADGPPPPQSSDQEIGGHIFDFLFASQDASTSSLLWAVALLESHPEVLVRVRAEVSSLWSPAEDGTWPAITAEMMRGMRYTEAVVREVIRFRPPATLVPHIAAEDVPLPAAGYTVPKGAIVFPSLLEASFQGFTEAERFDPDRFSEERQEDRLHKKNFLAFGAGAHQCVGQRYAVNHLVLFVTIFVSLVDFRRHRTDGCDEITYVPTIVPRDDCRVFLARRCKRYPDF